MKVNEHLLTPTTLTRHIANRFQLYPRASLTTSRNGCKILRGTEPWSFTWKSFVLVSELGSGLWSNQIYSLSFSQYNVTPYYAYKFCFMCSSWYGMKKPLRNANKSKKIVWLFEQVYKLQHLWNTTYKPLQLFFPSFLIKVSLWIRAYIGETQLNVHGSNIRFLLQKTGIYLTSGRMKFLLLFAVGSGGTLLTCQCRPVRSVLNYNQAKQRNLQSKYFLYIIYGVSRRLCEVREN